MEKRRPSPAWLALASALLLSCPARAEDAPTGAGAEDDAATIGRKVQAALHARGSEIFGCYDKEIAASGKKAAGEILLRMWIEPGGVVARVDVLKNQHGSTLLAECLRGTMERWHLPELAGAEMQQVVFPLAFHPPAGESVGGGAEGSATTPASPSTDRPALFVFSTPRARSVASSAARLTADVLIDTSRAPTGLSLSRLVLKPSARLALHKHPLALEILYVLRGRAHIRGTAPGKMEVAEAGDLVVLAAGVAHSIEAAPLAPLGMLEIFMPPGPEQAYLDPARREGTTVAKKTDAGPQPHVIHAAGQRAQGIAGENQSPRRTALTLLDDATGKLPTVRRVALNPGGEIPAHQHDAEEVVYVLEGKAMLHTGGRAYAVAMGDALHLPAHNLHRIVASAHTLAVTIFGPHAPPREEREQTQ